MRKHLVAGLLAVAALMFAGACTEGDNPNTPDIAAVTATAPVPGSPAVPGPEVTVNGVTASFNYYLPTEAKVTLKNNGVETQRVHLASYCVTEAGDKIHSQYRKEAVTADVKNDGKAVVLKVAGCVCRTQYDAGFGDPFPEGAAPFYPPEKMLDYRFAGAEGSICVPPSPPPPDPKCSDYTSPVIIGDIASDPQTAQVVFTAGTVAPLGGAFNPTLPAAVPWPGVGQTAGSFSTTYTLPYGPNALQCSVSKTFTKPVPPKDPPAHCDMDIAKAVNRSSAVPGEEVTYRIEIVNSGTANCTGGGVQIFDEIPNNLTYKRERHANNGSFTGNQSGTLRWNFDVMVPGESGWVEWDAKITNPPNNCQDFTIRNRAKVWSQQQGDVHSDEVSTFVDVTCQTCEPTHLNQTDGCYKPNPWGNGNNPEVICGYFNLVPTHKDESGSGDSYQFTTNAAMVVVHWGGASCTVNGAQSYSFTENVVSGQTVTNPAGNPGQGGFSFAQYCGCPSP